MKIAFPTDEHFPFQDDRARELALEIVRDFSPDVLIAGSDGVDFYSISHFDKNPDRIKVDLQTEIDLWRAGQMEWAEAAPKAKKRYLPGNHEDRLRRWLWRHPEFNGLKALKLESLLGFDSLGIEWNERDYEYAEVEYFDKLAIRHGKLLRQTAGASAQAELEADRYSISLMTGHSHRGGTVYATSREGVVIGQECFCLCRLDPEYLARPDWQQGIVLAEVSENTLVIEPVPFNWKDSFQRWKVAYWRGKEYLA